MDLDFIVQFNEDCEKCANHWRGRLIRPGRNDLTPELAKIYISSGDNEPPIKIDLLPDLLRISKQDIKQLRQPVAPVVPLDSGSNLKDLYVLGELGTLFNRCYNTVTVSRYRSDEGLRQLRNAVAIVKSCIHWHLDEGRGREAGHVAMAVLKLARSAKVGIPIMLDHGIDLIDAVPIQDARFDERFRLHTLLPRVTQIEQKRQAWRDRRGI